MAADYLAKAEDVLQALELAIQTAWVDVEDINIGRQLVPSSTIPSATIRIFNVPFEPSGIVTVEQTYRARIEGKFAWPPSGTVEHAKIERARSLMAAIVTGPTFADCHLPYIENVEFDESGGDEPEQTYEVVIEFACREQAMHH